MDHLLAFLGISFLIIVTPGPDTALVIKNSMSGGRRGGVFTAFGVALGQATWTLATSAGIAALLLASEPLFLAIKLAGAAYLVYLGAQALLSMIRSRVPEDVGTDSERSFDMPSPVALRQGLVSNLGNPKMAIFFTSLLPQFTPQGQASFLSLLILGLVFCSMTLVWLTGYAFAIAKAGSFLRRTRVRRIIEGVTGAVLIALGARLANEQR